MKRSDLCVSRMLIVFSSVVITAALMMNSACLPEPYSVGQPDSLLSEYLLVWDMVDQGYGGFCIRTQVDWDAVYSEHREDAMAAESWDELRDVVLTMLGELEDVQLSLIDPGGEEQTAWDPEFVNWDLTVWQQYMGRWSLPESLVEYAFNPLQMTQDSVGYGYISDLGSIFNIMIFFSMTTSIEGCSHLIIDLRMLSEGIEGNAQMAVGRFVADRELSYWRSIRNGPGRLDMSELNAVYAIKNGSWQFTNPVFLLVGRGTRGVGEQLTLLLASQDHVVLVGDTTAGSSGPANTLYLVNGWSVRIPAMVVYLPAETPVLGAGISPDIYVETTEADFLAGIDPVLDRALELVSE